MKHSSISQIFICSILVTGSFAVAQDDPTPAPPVTEAATQEVNSVVKAAAEKLAEAKNYTWTQSMSFGEREARTSTGKMGAGGHYLLNLPGRDSSMEVVLKGERAVMKREGSWEKVVEPAEGEGGRGGGFLARMILSFESPVNDLKELVSKVAGLTKQEDGHYSGSLGEEAAQEMMSFGRRGRRANADGGGGIQPPAVQGAGGKVTFTVADGVITKYVVDLTGRMNFNGEDRDVSRTTTVEFSDLGTTSFELSETAVGILYE